VTTAAALAAAVGAALLIVSEFTALYAIHVVGKSGVARTVVSGSHHGYALIPIGLLAGALALLVHRGGGRAPAVALAILGVIALAIALAGDLPDANKRGLLAAGAGFQVGTASPSVGFFLETLGAIVLMASGVVAWLAHTGETERGLN
jgi:hypothetical protein